MGYAQKEIPIASKIGEWSSIELFSIPFKSDSVMVSLQSRVLNFDATSAEIELSLVNESDNFIDIRCGIKPTTGTAYDNIVNIEEAKLIHLPIGDSVSFKMKLNGCVQKNTRKSTAVQKVQNCRPRLIFIRGWVED